MVRSTIVITAALALSAVLSAAPALAQRARVFVASYGSDSNPCTFGSPCKTFQQAVNVVAAGGEVTAIDSAGFGPINIIKSVTITSPNGVEAGIAAPPNGTAITISASPLETVELNGLTLDGDGGATNGIDFTEGGDLNIQNCVIRNFSAAGIYFKSFYPSHISISNTRVTGNRADGIDITSYGGSNVTGSMDHVTSANNGANGLLVTSTNPTGTILNFNISDSVFSNNGSNGVVSNASGGPVTVIIRNSTISNNASIGVSTQGGSGAVLSLTRSTITGNNVAAWDASPTTILTSFGDNDIFDNGANNNSPTSISHQ